MIRSKQIGEIIGYLRKEKEVTLEKLCCGLCSVPTLHRIEMGEREANIFLLERLLERLGETLEVYEVFASKEELEHYVHQEQIRNLQKEGRDREGRKELERYKKNMQKKDRLEQQFVKEMQAYFYKKDRNYKAQVKCLEEAIQMTVTRKADRTVLLSKMLLCKIELELLLKLADAYEELGERQRASKIRIKLWNYLEKNRIADEKKIELIPKIAYQIANLYIESGKADLAIFICEKAIVLDKKETCLYYLPELLYQKALCIEILYGKVKYKEIMYLCTSAYYIFEFVQKIEQAKEVKKFVEERLNGNL